jgi:branched-subunit amino acid ABC-type transport system permease component
MAEFLLACVNGLTSGSIVFLVAAGLTLVFGIGGVLNFAHGGVFAIGAYTMYTLSSQLGASWWAFAVSTLVAIGIAAALGGAAELLFVRRFYRLRHEYMLLGTYALLLILDGALQLIWGTEPKSSPAPRGLRGTVDLGPISVTTLSLFIILIALLALGGLYYWLQRTSFGHLAKAAAHDRDAAMTVGVNVPFVLTGVFVIGSMLAGVAGAVLAPNQSLHPELGNLFIIQAFVAVVLGGLGSVAGAWIAAIILGLADSLWFTYLPDVPQIGVFVVLVAILALKPTGVMGARA